VVRPTLEDIVGGLFFGGWVGLEGMDGKGKRREGCGGGCGCDCDAGFNSTVYVKVGLMLAMAGIFRTSTLCIT